MSGSMDITTTSDNAESPDTATAAAPTKPSLRFVDQAFTHLTTREQDLARGPLLLGFGDGFGDGQEHVQDPHPSHLGLELASVVSAHDPANDIIPPSLHWRGPLPSSAQVMTEPTISQSGRSLSLPSGSVSHETVYHPRQQMMFPGNQNSAALPLAWHYEFSWKNSRLCFGSTPIEIVEALEAQSSDANPASESRFSASQASFSRLLAESDPLSTAGIGGFCSSAEVRPTLSIPEDFEVSSINSSDFCYGSEFDEIMVDDYIPKSSDPGVAIAMENKAQWLAELLFDDFIRSYAPQQSRKQTAATKHQDLSSEPSNKAQRFAGDRGHVKKSRNSRAAGRNEGSGDETSDDDGQGPSPAAKSNDSKYLACPFLKWNPIEYAATCSLKFKQIRYVKRHIIGKHQRDYCPDCEMIYEETDIQTHVCDPNRIRPYDLLTKEKISAIEKIRGSEVEWKKRLRWYEIYEIIFPNQPRCFSPYFNKEADRSLFNMERYFRLPKVRERMESQAHAYHVRGNFLRLLFAVIFPDLWEGYGINDEGEPYMIHDKEPAARHAQPSKTVSFGEHDMIISHDTSSNTSQRPYGGVDMPQSCTVTGSTDYSASMPGIFPAQEQSENINSDFFPDLTYSGEFSDPARRGLMGICGSGSWEMLPGQNFTDPSWSAGFEVGSDLMSES
ncbi:Ff.00g133630.m01.CDS01 [Fusarium sp. VM40]|nr:Ff.00g133630.m01.CDS01 [Fusarium sp. VM40]